MKTLLKLTSNITNFFHQFLENIFKLLNITISDKHLHFIVIGVIGIILYFIITVLFKYLIKISIELISFIFTLTILIVLTVAIEIQQFVTGSGNMEFYDIVYGLLGFVTFIGIYLVIRVIGILVTMISQNTVKKRKVK